MTSFSRFVRLPGLLWSFHTEDEDCLKLVVFVGEEELQVWTFAGPPDRMHALDSLAADAIDLLDARRRLN